MTIQNANDLLTKLRELTGRIDAKELDKDTARQHTEALGDEILESNFASDSSDTLIVGWTCLCTAVDYDGDIVLAHLQDLKEKAAA